MVVAYLGLLQRGCMHVDIVAQAASQETSTVHHVEGKGKEHQACMWQQSSSATCLRRHQIEKPAL